MKSTRPKRRLASLQSLLLVLGVLVAPAVAVASVLTPQTAQAAVAADDVVFGGMVDDIPQIQMRHGTTVTDLTSDSHGAEKPDVSPDGSKIAFIRAKQNPNNSSIWNNVVWVMNSDGSGAGPVTSFGTSPYYGSDTFPRWSPDGTRIVFQRTYGGGDQNLVSVDVADYGLTQLTTNDDSYGPVAWSPTKTSGKYRIVYSGASNLSNFTIMDDDGGNKRLLVDSSIAFDEQWSPAWSPDGSRIYYGYSHGTRYYSSTDGFATDYNITDHALAIEAWSQDAGHSVSADGSAVVVNASRNGCGSCIFSISTSSGDVTQLTSGSYDLYPSYVKADWSIKHFAVLGDSFSSGEGNPPFIYPTDTNGCHRSDQAYAKVLDSHPVGLSLTAFVACSGATTGGVISGRDGESSQLLAPASTDDYVILTIGGNDAQFNEFATDCVTSNCDGSTQDTTTKGLITNTLPGNLDTLFGDIADAVSGTSTRVLVLGYPYILPTDASGINCSYLTSGERTEATNVQIDIDGAIHSAVTRAGAPFEYIDANATGSPFAGHELCSSGTYFNGLDLVNNEYSFHPNESGQAAYAQLVTDYLAANPS